MGLWPGAPYDYTAKAGRFVLAAGACPLDENGVVVGRGDVEAQSLAAVENLRLALAAEGAELTDIVKTTIYVAANDRSELVRAWDAISPILGRAPSTLLGVSMLGYPGQLVEVEAVAYLGD